jgi:hypothetical protein
VTLRDLTDGRIAALFRYDLANVIWPPFCLREKSSSLLVWALPSWQSKVDFGRGEGGKMLSANVERKDSHPSPFCYLLFHLQPDDTFSLFSKFFQYLAHLNG